MGKYTPPQVVLSMEEYKELQDYKTRFLRSRTDDYAKGLQIAIDAISKNENGRYIVGRIQLALENMGLVMFTGNETGKDLIYVEIFKKNEVPGNGK